MRQEERRLGQDDPPQRRRARGGGIHARVRSRRMPLLDRAVADMRLAVFASHEGTTLQAILDAVRSGRLSVPVAVVVSNNRESGALRRARAAGVPAVHLSGATHPDSRQLDAAILATLREHGVDPCSWPAT